MIWEFIARGNELLRIHKAKLFFSLLRLVMDFSRSKFFFHCKLTIIIIQLRYGGMENARE